MGFYVSFAGQNLDMELFREDANRAAELICDIDLLVFRTELEVDRCEFENLNVASVFCQNNTVFYVFDGRPHLCRFQCAKLRLFLPLFLFLISHFHPPLRRAKQYDLQC